ncbi:hypothetical protein WT24_17970 [Burkholderia sp. MSMB1078WGS]|nr:hypothetical protein WT24_17970 [Burkholderia sp. MSMB1078WGS]
MLEKADGLVDFECARNLDDLPRLQRFDLRELLAMLLEQVGQPKQDIRPLGRGSPSPCTFKRGAA